MDGMINGMHFEFPHCDSTVLHAPGECTYCDGFPQRQSQLQLAGVPFSPLEANGWSGNVAVRAGQLHTHMGATFVAGEPDIEPVKSWWRRALDRMR